VIKPMPSNVALSAATSPFAVEEDSWRDEDEVFLDQDDPKSFASDTQSIATFIALKNATNQRSRPYAHIVYKSKAHQHERHSDFAELEPSRHSLEEQLRSQLNLTSIHLHQDVIGSHPTRNASQSAHRRSKRQAPDTVWPEVLLVVDYDSYLLHGANSRDVKRYFISFWNGVDLRYKLLSQPTIRISLAGMIVAKVRINCSLLAPLSLSLFLALFHISILPHLFVPQTAATIRLKMDFAPRSPARLLSISFEALVVGRVSSHEWRQSHN
jgi:hypothetical protein